MTTQISTFNFKSNPVRIETINNEPYFALKDVCLALAIQVASPERFNLDPQGVTLNVIPTIKGNQELTFINEPNLYRIIFKSRKAEAVEFQNWVFEEVLPQIRKTGQYSQNTQQIAPLAPQKKKRGRPAINPFGYETYEREFTAKELEVLVQLWYYANRQHRFLKSLAPAFDVLQSHYTDELKRFWGDSMSIDWAGDIIARIADGADVMRFAPLIELEKASRRKQALLNARF